jgi:hypothetical protein
MRPNRTGTGRRKQDQRRDGLQSHGPLHRQLPRESRALEAARRPPRQDIPRGHPRRSQLLADREHREHVTPGRCAASPTSEPATDEQRKAPGGCHVRGRATLRSCGGTAPPREAVRVVDNASVIRRDLLVHSREPGGAARMRMLPCILPRLRSKKCRSRSPSPSAC